MTRNEILNMFIEKFFPEKSNEKIMVTKKYFDENKEQLAEEFIDSFKKICIKIKEMQKKDAKGKIGFICYSMLRSSLGNDEKTHIINAYDNTWYFDTRECYVYYKAGWAFNALNLFEEEMEKERKRYSGKITASDTKAKKMEEASKYNSYITELARYAMPRAIETEEYKNIEKEDYIEIRVGEYMDISEVVHKSEVKRENDNM